ncbi:ketopantoate reductase PanE/ApbA C terminal-domain-containing protein [Mariannaea sp. PMI_226]|nr:ketopantoate reductase PanE/ApbA C terminal-domain-containing protein [Mariannaea sp. PMI_226]
MYSQRPAWLESILEDQNPPSRLYAWSPENLGLQGVQVRKGADDLDRRIFVLGLGNLGRLFATCLAKSPDYPPITLVVHREDLLKQWAGGVGIEILRSGILEANKNFEIEWWTDSQPDIGPVHEVLGGRKLKNLIISTKATVALPQVERLRGYLDQKSTVVFVQNGISKLWPPHGPAYVSHRFAPSNAPSFLACVTTHGVTSQGAFKSLHASQADVAIGMVLPSRPPTKAVDYLIRQLLSAPNLAARHVSRTELWILQLEKLVVNSIINPLTAIFRCKNGELFTDSTGPTARVLDILLAEASQVLQRLVAHESSAEIIGNASTEISIDVSPQGLQNRFSEPRLKEMVYNVGHKVRENTSSMLQDVQAGKSTEIRDFNGWLVETAAFLDPNLDISGHRSLIDLVEAGDILRADELELLLHRYRQ